jgi:OmpA-OmpF porin, OOP family
MSVGALVRGLVHAALLTGLVAVAAPVPVEAQVLNRLKRAARDAVEGEASAQIDRMIRNAIRCAVDDPICYEQAAEAGKDIVFVDDEGEVIVGEDGAPITERDEARAAAGHEEPGTGGWANYDFVPGEEILFFDDYSADRVGDFPRRLELVEGAWEIVDWRGAPHLRATANGVVAVPLPRTLPDRFTVEYPVVINHGNAWVRLTTGRAFYGPARSYKGSVPTIEATRAGVRPVGEGVTALAQFDSKRTAGRVLHFRVMADGEHMKVYLGEQRVANLPRAVFPRSDTLFIIVSSAREQHPVLLGPIRVAAGGRDLYDRLERDGRVSTQGILFATNSDRIRPESTPTLHEIGTMLQQHERLSLRIEGHTDAEGDEDYNLELSRRRAAAVKRHLVEHFGIDAGRLSTDGYGESKPAADNATAEGRQANRRVDLVRTDT